MLQISVSSDASQLLTAIGKLRADKLPKAITAAANELGSIVNGALKSEMSKSFDRPTPYTLRGLNWKRATLDKPMVRIWIEDAPNKGTAPSEYLTPEMRGGHRVHKRFERALIAAGHMRADQYAVPGRAAPLDAYGNVPAGFIRRMLGDLKAAGEQNPKSARKRRTGAKRFNYFFRAPGYRTQHLKPGVYWHLPSNLIVPVFLFVGSPNYQTRYPFYDIGRNVYDRYKDRVIARHLKAALAS